jgi:septal ring factor EnvC (AmiA/AmiB activator)
MNLFNLLNSFFEKCFAAFYAKSRLEESQQQHRAEIFALEQSLHVTESERNSLKLQVAAIESDHNLTKNKLEECEKKCKQFEGIAYYQTKRIEERVEPTDTTLPGESCL